MGSSTTTQSGSGSTEQNREPWAPTQPHLQNIMNAGQAYYGSGIGSNVYPGPDVAPLNPTLNNSLTGMFNTAVNNPTAAGDAFESARSAILNNGMTADMQPGLDVYRQFANGSGENPYLRQLLNEQATNVRNQVNSNYSGSGRYGSAGHDTAVTNAISAAQLPVLSQAYESDQNRRLQGAAGLLQNYQQGAQRALQYGAISPNLYNAQFAPWERAASVGDFLQGRDQQALQGERQRFEAQEAMPWTQLARYGAALGYISPFAGNAGSVSGTTTNQSTTERPYGFMDYLSPFSGGTNSSAYGMGSFLNSLPFISDRDEKTDIKKVGKSETTGLPLYSYRYKDDPKTYPKVVGPMAQDIEKQYPGATSEVGGKMVVKPQYAGLLGAL